MAILFGQVRRHRSCWRPPPLLVSRYPAVTILLGPTSMLFAIHFSFLYLVHCSQIIITIVGTGRQVVRNGFSCNMAVLPGYAPSSYVPVASLAVSSGNGSIA